MQTVIVNCEAPSYIRCSSCGSNTRKCERYLQIFNTNKNGEWKKGERYCVHCEKYARLNNEHAEAEIYRNKPPSYEKIDCDESGLRMREEYAAYQASGCANQFWSDRDAGYIR